MGLLLLAVHLKAPQGITFTMAFVNIALLPPLTKVNPIRSRLCQNAPVSRSAASRIPSLSLPPPKASTHSSVKRVLNYSLKVFRKFVFDFRDGLSSGGNGGRIHHGRRRFSDGPGDGDDSFAQQSSLIAYTAYLVAKQRSSYPTQWPQSRNSSSQSILQLLQQIRVSHIILAINVAIFAYQALIAPSLLMAGAKINSAIAAGEYYRLISPMFLHGSATHLLVNSFSLHSTGPSVESWFGKQRFLALYVISGICGNALSYFCSPTAAVGASGAIFGLVGATAVLLSRHRKLLGPKARRGLQSLVYIVVLNFGMGLTPGSRIDNYGHLGGFLGGIAYSYFIGPRLVVRRTSSGRSFVYDEPVAMLALRDVRIRLNQLLRFFSRTK